MNKKSFIVISSFLLFGFIGGFAAYLKSKGATATEQTNTPFCMNGPESEMSLLQVSVEKEITDDRMPGKNGVVKFEAAVDETVPRFPPMAELVLKLRKNLEESCQKLSYPMLSSFEFSSEIWAKPAFIDPKPWTYYSGSSDDFRSLGFIFEKRERFNNLSECLQQPLFRYGDRIVFYAYRKLSKDVIFEGRSAIVCGGQFDGLDHWESEDVH